MSENVGNNQASNEATNQGLAERQLGAKMLNMAGFRQRRETVDEYDQHRNIVDSSFERVKNRGEKMVGKNDERRVDTYLSRLKKIIEKGGNEYEKKLWQDSIKEDLLVQYENIPESYWESKRQELRDNQQGGVDLNESLKRQYCEEERKLQRESLEKWANYLGDENCPYPLWFKVYAWDGMTKMGRYSKEKARYETRNETTVAPYPYPDAEVLAKTFEVVNQYYGNSQKEFFTDEGERNIPLEKVVQSGSFVTIFNGIQRDIAPILQPPENPEDVDGQWLEYSLGDEDDIARAARGTGWCVATPAVGRHYLTYGTYGNDYGGDDWDDGESQEELQSKFILFHLTDPKTGKLSKTACASIRIGPDGNVAEISGIEKGQALTDSVVPTVEEKVKSLPGGEAFLKKFADKNKLIELDHKMQRGEDITAEELRFIWEVDRPIETLDTYNTNDPRIDELREKYNIEYAIRAGVGANELVSNLHPFCIANNLDTLINHGANIDVDELVSHLDPYGITDNLDTLINHGANIDVDELVSRLNYDYIVNNLDTLINHGANIDELVSHFNPRQIAESLDTFINHGANIDVDELVSHLDSYDIDMLINHGANIDTLASRFNPDYIVNNLDTFINHGANIDKLMSHLEPGDIANNLDALINHGANIDIDELVSNLHPFYIADSLDTLINHGADIDVDELVSRLDPYDIADSLDTLINHGADIDVDELVSRLDPYDIAENLDTLINHGADIDVDELVSRLDPDYIAENLDTLIKHGAHITSEN